MKWRWKKQHFALIPAYLTLVTPPSLAQLPPRLEKCSPYPTLAREISDLQEQAPHTKVEVAGVTFRGDLQLPGSIRAQLIRSLKQMSFDAESDDWVARFQNAVRDAWQDHGYFAVLVDVEPHVVSNESGRQRVVMDVSVQAEVQYRLDKVLFKGGTVFSQEELHSQIPLGLGDVFSVLKIRRGIERLTRLYASRGYIDFTVTPETSIVGNSQRILLILELDEGPLFRVGTIKILGLDRRTEYSLRLRLRAGDPFNWNLVEDFFRENKSLLPADASVLMDTMVKRNMMNSTVDIELDFRTCPR